MSENERCADCRFWTHLEIDYGACRRFPPQVTAESQRWPQTRDYSWCGEFRCATPDELTRRTHRGAR